MHTHRSHRQVRLAGGAVAVVVLAACLVPTAAFGAAVSLQRSRGLAGARALVAVPENSFWGYDTAIHGALLARGFEVAWGEAEDLADAEKLESFDLVATNIKRGFSRAQVAALKAYVARGGALYGSWGGPMSSPELLRICGVKGARSVHIKAFTLLDSPLTRGRGEQRWPFPSFAGYLRMGGKGHEMVSFDLLDGVPAARDDEGRCMGALRQEGEGRCAVLGFCPSNYRFVTDQATLADECLDNLLAWLLPRGAKEHHPTDLVEVCLPRSAEVRSVSLNGTRVGDPAVKKEGSLSTVTLPVAGIRPGRTATVRIALRPLTATRHVETWLHFPTGQFFTGFDTPAQAADFLAAVGATVVQPLLRYDGGSICYRPGIPGDRPRGRIASYSGDYLAEYVDACHERGIRVIGGLYLDWKRYEVHHRTAPPLVEKGGREGEENPKRLVCPLDSQVQAHNLGIIENLLTAYPKLDGVILDDNFEFQRHPCHCAACLEKYRAHCRRRGVSEDRSDGEWKAFWRGEMLAFCKRVHDLCAAHRKPVGGWSGGRGVLAFKGVFDFAGDMHYLEAASSVASVLPLTGDLDVVTLLWGMNRRPAEMEAEVGEAIRAGSRSVGFWLAFQKIGGSTDNRWSVGSRPGDGNALTPGSIDAITRAFARAEKDWREYYRDNLIRGDGRFVVTGAKLDANSLRVEIENLGRRAERRIMGPVDLEYPSGATTGSGGRYR